MSLRRSGFPILVLLLPLLALFRRALFLGEQFAFRDVSHYYRPYYEYVQWRWQFGIPLWNPLDNLGQPLLADPTAAVFYPAKLVFSLPLDFERCFAIYVVGHLWLAGVGLYYYARRLGANRQGALVGALSYELSGQVLFQYCNPIFCVGAAWLPWVMLYAERIGDGKNAHKSAHILLAICLSLMVLGGDPQTAYHCMLVIVARLVFVGGSWSTTLGNKEANQSRWRVLRRLIVACSIALMLCALQVLPSIEWSRLSDRVPGEPTTVWSYLVSETDSDFPDWLLKSSPDSVNHASRVYDFSVGPWRWIELVWPNISGPLFPQNGRWIGLLPAEKRMWVPSLYLGLPTFLLSIVGILRSRSSRCFRARSWLVWLAALSVLAAMGEYGVGWLVNEARYAVSRIDYEPTSLHPAAGGLYWLLVKLLPGYSSFRYPAKWWTMASMALCVLAAKGHPLLRHASMRRHRRIQDRRWRWMLVAAVSVIAFVSTLAGAVYLMKNFGSATNSIFGPFREEIAWQSIGVSFAHACVLLAVIGLLFRTLNRHPSVAATVHRWSWLLIVLDLCIAQSSLVRTAESSSSPSKPTVPSTRTVQTPITTIYRSSAERAYPVSWQQTSERQRLTQLQQLEVSTRMPKHHMALRTRSVFSSVSMAAGDYMAMWNAVREERNDDPPLEFLSLLGVDAVLAPANAFSLEAQSIGHQGQVRDEVATPLARFANPHPLPRAWLVQDWQKIETSSTPQELSERVLFSDGSFNDFETTAFVESESVPAVSGQVHGASKSQANSCEIIVSKPERVVVEATIEHRSLLILGDQYYPGWEASLLTSDKRDSGGFQRQRVPIVRTNHVMRGVFLDPGRHKIEFRYRPKIVVAGLTLSVTAWILSAMAILRNRARTHTP